VAPSKTLRLLVRARGAGPLPTGCPAGVKFQIASLEPWATMFFTDTQAVFGKEQNVPKLAPSLFRIAATNLGETCFQTNEAIADLRGDANDPVIIELAGAGAIRGLMHGASPGSVVALTSLNPADTAQRRVAYSDANGHFSFETLPPGRYAIAGKEIEVEGGKAAEVEIAQ